MPNCAGSAPANIFSSVSESLASWPRPAAPRATAPYARRRPRSTYFLSLQCADGGFTARDGRRHECSDASVDATGTRRPRWPRWAGHDDAERAKAAWLISQRKAGGYWIVQGGRDVNSTGLAVRRPAGCRKNVADLARPGCARSR